MNLSVHNLKIESKIDRQDDLDKALPEYMWTSEARSYLKNLKVKRAVHQSLHITPNDGYVNNEQQQESPPLFTSAEDEASIRYAFGMASLMNKYGMEKTQEIKGYKNNVTIPNYILGDQHTHQKGSCKKEEEISYNE